MGLGYLSLARASRTLSGGESQRIRLATQIGSKLVNVLYILDEPSIGLHQRDNRRLIRSLEQLRDAGNSVIVVEHDEEMMRAADYIVDVGPGAGPARRPHRGRRHVRRDPARAERHGRLPHGAPADRGAGASAQGVRAADRDPRCPGQQPAEHQRGVSAGRVRLRDGRQRLGQIDARERDAAADSEPCALPFVRSAARLRFGRGIEHVDKLVVVDQSPIGRSPRSNPATYSDVFTDIRKLFEKTPDAQIRGYKAGRFSFNVKGGRCEECRGAGVQTIEMNFLPDVYVTCRACGGHRYNRETLEVRYKGRSIDEVLNMTVNMAVEFFENIPAIPPEAPCDPGGGAGLPYAGAALHHAVGRREPAHQAGLRALEARHRPHALHPRRADDGPPLRGHTPVAGGAEQGWSKGAIRWWSSEHNLDVIKVADHLIDIGPEGGAGGGEVVAAGTPEEVARCERSHTGRFLAQMGL